MGRKAPGLPGKGTSEPLALLSSFGLFVAGGRVSVLCVQGLGVENDVMLQQLDSISSEEEEERETANFLAFANLANLILAGLEVLSFTVESIILFTFI